MHVASSFRLIAVLDGVGVRYRSAGWVVRNFCLEVGAGDRVALVGPSGSGKSTVLSILAGGLTATEGTVVCNCPRGVRLVNQANSVLGRRSVFDNVALSVLAARRAGLDVDVDIGAALDAVGLGDRVMAAARRLSGGETQRLCVARSMISEPSLVVADEPTGQLDVANTALVADRLLAAPASTAVVVATHDLTVASRFDRVIDIAVA